MTSVLPVHYYLLEHHIVHEWRNPNHTACRSAGSKTLSVDIAVAVIVHHQYSRSFGRGHFNFISRKKCPRILPALLEPKFSGIMSVE